MGLNYKDSFKRIDFMGQSAVRWLPFDRHIRFLQALAQANMIKRLSSDDGQGWVQGVELHRLPGLKTDKFDRAAQLRAMEILDLIQVGNPHVQRVFWESQLVQIGDLGLKVIQFVKDGAETIIITEDGTARAVPLAYQW